MQVIAVCSVCGNNNSQYKADDGPAWLVLLIIGQFFLAPILSFKFILTWSTPALLGTLLPGAVVLTLLLLPLAKGLFIGLEWARS